MNSNNKSVENRFGIHMKNGWTPFSNLLDDLQEELNLTNSDLLFIMRIMRYSIGFTVKNSIFKLTDTTVQRTRKRLSEMGYLKFNSVQKTDEKGIYTIGTIYDLSPLWNLLNDKYNLSNKAPDVNVGTPDVNVGTPDVNVGTPDVKDRVLLEHCTKSILKEHFTTTEKKISSSEIEKAKVILKEQAELIDNTLSSSNLFYDYKENGNYTNLVKFVNSLKYPLEKELIKFLQQDIYSPILSKIVEPVEILSKLGSYTVEGFTNNSFNNKNGDLVAYSFNLFSQNQRRLQDLVLYEEVS